MTAVSKTQSKYSSSNSKLSAYKDLYAGKVSNLSFLLFEFYQLVVMPLPGLLGFGLRAFWAKFIFGKAGKSPAIGKHVSIRGPKGIRLGSGVIVEEFSSLDCRDGEISLGDKVFIGRGSIIASKTATITLENGVNIGSECRIATETSLKIGESTLVAAYCYIGPGNHASDDISRPIIEQEMIHAGGVKIGSGCWIGTRVTILDGVTIGNGAIIGAHSLVTTDVPENGVAVGAPAKVIRTRS